MRGGAELPEETPNGAVLESGDNEAAPSALRERMATTFAASLRHQWVVTNHSVSNTRLRDALDRMNRLSTLYFKYHVPLWPPRLLLRKIVRYIVFPVLYPQIEYNEAVRDCAVELRSTLEYEVGAMHDALKKIQALEEKIEMLETQMRHSHIGQAGYTGHTEAAETMTSAGAGIGNRVATEG